jgi:hypothetical protein
MLIRFNKKLFFILSSVFLLPSFIFVALHRNSLAPGLILVLLMLFIYFSKIFFIQKFKKNRILFFSILLFLLMLLSIYNFLIYHESKPILSLPFMIIMLAVSYQFAIFLTKVKVDSIIRSIFWLILLILFFGWLKFLYIPEFLGYTGAKATFPFSEESHFALALGMLAITYSFVGKQKWNIFIWFNMLLLSLLYPSLTLLVFTMMLLLVFLFKSRPLIFKSTFFILVPLGLVVFSYLINHMEYFSSRLSFEDSKNLTTLVWLQGWQLAYLNFIDTNGIGLGFQMLGKSTTMYGNITHIMISLLGGYTPLNAEDGGFLAAKLIAEFGLIGIFIVLAYGFFLVKILHRLRKLYRKQLLTEIEKRKLLAYGIIFSFFVEMFLRGYGYFSPGVLMIFISIIFLSILNKRYKIKPI